MAPAQQPTWYDEMVGSKLAGRYELREVVGHGGMGAVFRAYDQRMKRVVAVKVLNPGLVDDDPRAPQRFRAEALLVAGLDGHPCLVTVFETNDEDDQTGEPYIAMQYVTGQTLADVLSDGPLSVAEAVWIVGDVLSALAHAHAGGVVHRDIKPANVMITADGQVKVVDFGIARAVDATVMTTTGRVLGTPHYIAPERVLGQPVDARADLYSTGCLLFQALTGRPPFVGDNWITLAHAHVYEPPPRPTALRPDLPAVVDDIITKALAKDPKDRYRNANDFRTALAGLSPPPSPISPRDQQQGAGPSGSRAGPVVRLGRLGGIVDYQARPPSSEAEVAVACREIAGRTASSVDNRWYTEFAKIVQRLEGGRDYRVEEKERTVEILEPGIERVEDYLGVDNLYESPNAPLIEFLDNAIRAKELFERDKDYVVLDGRVLVLDEHTGRVLFGRRYDEGMHQAIEAKEGVAQTLASITWPADSPPVRLSGIDWRVLHVALRESGRQALLLADRVIGTGPYNEAQVATTWEWCDLRRWLNEDLARSLGDPLASRVLRRHVQNGPNPLWGTDGGKDTTDQFFLLSMEEAVDWLMKNGSDWKKYAKGAVSDKLIAKNEGGKSALWWLRSPGLGPVNAACVGEGGSLLDYGNDVSASSVGVRPAFWLNLES